VNISKNKNTIIISLNIKINHIYIFYLNNPIRNRFLVQYLSLSRH